MLRFSYGCLRQADGWGWLQSLTLTTTIVQLWGLPPPTWLFVRPGFCCHRCADNTELAPGLAARSDNTCTGTLVRGLASQKPGATLRRDSCWQRLPLSGGRLASWSRSHLEGALVLVSVDCPVEGGGSHFRGQCEWYGGVVLRGILGWGQAHGVSLMESEKKVPPPAPSQLSGWTDQNKTTKACLPFCPWRKSHHISAFLAHFLKLANGSPLHLNAFQAIAPVLGLEESLCINQEQSLGFLQLSGSPRYTPCDFQRQNDGDSSSSASFPR